VIRHRPSGVDRYSKAEGIGYTFEYVHRSQRVESDNRDDVSKIARDCSEDRVEKKAALESPS